MHDVRVGLGYDIHRLVEGRPLVLGGIAIDWDRGLLGHSDADAVVHAIIDALLGAAALGDIGTHFSDRDERWRGADSIALLEQTVALLAGRGFAVGNVDTVVVAEAPRLAPHIHAMRARLAGALGIAVERVSVKATTDEGLGPVGRREAIAARAVALIHSHGPEPSE
jgi:2-C-methyl-D-erythritol 2,4-cyclodiphosphate synthase